MSAITNEPNVYATLFSETADRLPGNGLAWLRSLRAAALDRFIDLGFPSTHLEEWKYTNVAPISRLAFRPAPRASRGTLPDSVRSDLDLFPNPRLVFIDGVLAAELSGTGRALIERPYSSGPVYDRAYLKGLANTLADGDPSGLLESSLGQHASVDTHAFAAWNTAFFTDGGCLVVPSGVAVPDTVFFVFVSTAAADPTATFPRNLVIAGERSQVRFAEVFLPASGGIHLINTVTEIVAGADSVVDYCMLQRQASDSFHVSMVQADLGRDASFVSHSFSFSGALARHDLRVALDGEGAQCRLAGLFFLDGGGLVDNHTLIDHRKPHTTSRELYKGILGGQAQGVFNGAVIVRKDAQKTDAVQHSRNLLLSENAQIDTKPQLEIRADDVRCAHGASIGQLDQEALFYLRTRGVSEAGARNILVRAFAEEIFTGVHDPAIRRYWERLAPQTMRVFHSGNQLNAMPDPALIERPYSSGPQSVGAVYDRTDFRKDFPGLQQDVHGKPLVYLDNAATTQKPYAVIRALDRFYRLDCSNVHRAVHELSDRATQAYEAARTSVKRFINARSDHEIIFVRGTTEAINLVANSYGRSHIKPGDEILISALEHHSNIVPWQLLCEQTGGRLVVAPINDAGELILQRFEDLLGPKTAIVAIAHVSNALGTVLPVREIIRMAHGRNVPVLIDGAQAVSHFAVDVGELDCDFYAFSGHKIFGPTGIGILYGREELLERMPPYQGGGDMIRSVTFEKTTYNDLPYKFEAGTPHIAGAIGLGAAVDYLTGLGMENISVYEKELLAYGDRVLRSIPGLRLIGTAKEKAGVLSFVLQGIHPHDVGSVLDRLGIAVRTGHHCAQPVMSRFGVAATTRASLAFYNKKSELDALADGIRRVQEVFKR
jgi:cysteine desulfurase/selenocysteine lyase